MLHRFLFVAGMTVGVMTPLLWAAYVARPVPHTAHAPTVQIAKVMPDAPKPTPHPTTTNDVTASIPRAEPMPPKPAEITLPKPSGPQHSTEAARGAPTRSTTKVARVKQPHRTPERDIPAVVDSYNGAHIITICAALTGDEQLRAGCP